MIDKSINYSFHSLAQFGRELLDKKTLSEGLPLISSYAKDILNSERCSIFVYDEKNKELWTVLADGVERIVVPKRSGLVGKALKERKAFFQNTPYEDENFLVEIDKKTGFKTENIIVAPIFNSKREILGVLELLNKKGGFDEDDIKFVEFFAHYISGFIELANEYLPKEINFAK